MPRAEFMLWLYKPEHLGSCGAAYSKMSEESTHSSKQLQYITDFSLLFERMANKICAEKNCAWTHPGKKPKVQTSELVIGGNNSYFSPNFTGNSSEVFITGVGTLV